MGWSWKKTTKSKQKQTKDGAERQKKPRSKTFILEEIISPSVVSCPIIPIDDSLAHIPGLELFTQEELVAAILGNNSVVDINNIDAESLFEDYFAKIDEYLTENPTEADAFDVDNLSTWPTLEALINPGQPTVEIPDVGGAVGTLPPPVTVPIDPPRNNYNKDYDFPLENQPLVGIIDTGFSGNNPDIDYSRITLGSDRLDNDNNPLLNSGEGSEHGTHVLGIIGATRDNGLGIDGINDNAPLWLGRTIGSGEWAESLREFVDNFRESGKKNGIANLSLDLTQTDKNGITTTRYELTPEERVALEYARQNGVLIVTAAGNDGGVMSVLGQASQEFDNIITVGAADGENRAAYSSYGNGLDILAPGGTESNPLLSTVGDGLGKMAGTSVATAQVSGAASLVWAANPDLNYSQVKEILKSTAQDVQTPGWDEETGAGLLNIDGAVEQAKVTVAEEYKPVASYGPETWSGEGIVTPGERAVATEFLGKYYEWSPYVIQPGDTLSEIAYRTMGGGTAPYYNFIAQKNGIANPNYIYVGQNILIPRQVAAPTPPAPPQPKPQPRPILQPQPPIEGRPIEFTGEVVFKSFEGGFYGVISDYILPGGRDTSYLPLGQEAQQLFKGKEGSRVRLQGIPKNVPTYQMWGQPIEVLSVDFLSQPLDPIAQEAIEEAYQQQKAKLGAATTEPIDLGNGFLKQNFEGGYIVWNGNQAIAYITGPGTPTTPTPENEPLGLSQVGFDGQSTHQTYINTFNRNGGSEKLGFPINNVHPWAQGHTQDFDWGSEGRGAIMKAHGENNSYWVGGKIWEKFLDLGGAGYSGYPTTDAVSVAGGLDNSGGKVQHFRGAEGIATKIWLSQHGAHPTWGAIGGRYDSMGGPSSWLGFPTGREQGIGSGWVKQDFEGGYMLWHPQHGTTVYNTKAVESLPADSGNGSTNEWNVQFWNNKNLSGTPAWTRTDSPGELRFAAGTGAPPNTIGVGEDNFSVRWQTTSDFEGGFYHFKTKADDGMRVYVDGVLVNEKWAAVNPFQQHDAYIAIPQGKHDIRIDYFEAGGSAAIHSLWEPTEFLEGYTGDFRPVGYDGNQVHGNFVGTYQRNGAIAELGYPINNVHRWQKGHIQDFDGGAAGKGGIMKADGEANTYWVGGEIWDKFLDLGSAEYVGYPTTDAIPLPGGAVQHFRGAAGIPTKIWLSEHGAHPTWGGIGAKYEELGATDSFLGFPTSGEIGLGDGWIIQNFEGGYILYKRGYPTIAYDTKAIDTLPADSGESSTSNWHAQYWNNQELTGTPQWSQYEEMSDLRFHAGNGAPVGTRGIEENNFSGRWITTSYFDGGIYNFINRADDGVRVYLDGNLIIDKWKDSPFEEKRAFYAVEPGYHQVMVEYYENSFSAANHLRWEQANSPEEWAGEFFRGKDLNPKDFAGNRGGGVDFLDKDWGNGREGGIAIGVDDFSDRWATTRYFDSPGVYEFTSQADDGVRVWVDDKLVIDKWKSQAFATNKVLVPLDEGYHRIRVEHYENAGAAANKLNWQKVAGTPDGENDWSQPWVAQYFNNRDLQGAPAVTRLENTYDDFKGGIYYNVSETSPDIKVNRDNFSTRLTSHRYLEGGTYKFNLKGDDGVRLFVNGEKIIDRWQNPPFNTAHEQEIILPAGIHRIEVEHSEKYGLAYAGIDWNFLEKQSDLQPGATTTGENQPEILATYENLVAEFGASAIGVPITPLTTEYDSPQPPPGMFAPAVVLPTGQIQEFRGTNGRGAILKPNNNPPTYVFGKLWDAFQNMGGTETLGYPLSSQQDLGNGAAELELENGKLFWAPGMTNPTYYEYTNETLTIPADSWRGEYFDNRDWKGNPVVVRSDSASGGNLDKYWSSGTQPALGMPDDNFSVRWTSNRPFDRGTYRFISEHDDGFVVEVNGQKPINKMMEVATHTTGYGTFTHGGQYPVEVKHREYGGAARAKLQIEKASPFVVGLDANNNLSPQLPVAFNKHGGYERVGLPINDVHSWGSGYVQDFDHGANGRGILMRRHNTTTFYYLHGKIWDTYLANGGANGKLGYPTSDRFNDGYGNTAQEFENNRITRRPNGETFVGGYVNGHRLPGDFYRVWKKYKGTIGNPLEGVQHYNGSQYIRFQNGSIVSSQYGTFPLYGAIRSYFLNTTGGLGGSLGAPKSGEYSWNGGTRQDFAGGYILWKGGQAVGYRYDGALLYPSPVDDGGGGTVEGALLTQQGAGYFKARPQFYTTGNIFHKSGWGSNLLGGGWNPQNNGGHGTQGNCTWYANGRVQELGGNSSILNIMSGNAGDWDNQLRNAGYGQYIHSSPQPGDIAQWDSNHVAVVESVNNDGTITISESHWKTSWDGGLGTLHNVRTISKNNPTRYIRVPGVKVESDNSDSSDIILVDNEKISPIIIFPINPPISLPLSQNEYKIKELKNSIVKAGEQFGIPPRLIASILLDELNRRNIIDDTQDILAATSPEFVYDQDWSIGIPQMKPKTAKEVFANVLGYCPIPTKIIEELLNDERAGFLVGAYLSHTINLWKNDYPNISEDYPVLGTLYSLGFNGGENGINANPKPNQRGIKIAEQMIRITEIWDFNGAKLI